MKRTLPWLGAATSLLFVLACFLPTELPRHYTFIEDSLIQVLHWAFVHHLQFGKDIVYTFGPWGFLYGGYRPETHILSALIWLPLAIVFWWASWRTARLSFENKFAAWLWVMSITSLTDIPVVLNIDVRLLCWPLLLLLLYFFAEDRAMTITQCLLVFSMGMLSLVKFSVLIQCTVVILIIGADTIWRRKRFPWSLSLFCASILFFWLIAGQRLSSLGLFIRNSLYITSGYNETVAESAPGEMKYIAWFLVVAIAAVGTAKFAIWKRLRFFGLFPLAGLGFIVFSIFKYGFVRDDAHQAISALLLLLVSLVCLAILWPAMRSQKWSVQSASLLPVVAAFIFAIFSFERCSQRPLLGQLAETLAPRRWLGPIELLHNGGLFRATWEQYLTNYREEFPLPPLKGDTDYYSWNQMTLFAHGIPYRPRPVFHSYSAYTPYLAELNAAHLRSAAAAPTIVFDAAPIDHRYNSLEDGLSWPELLTRYDLQQVEFPFIVLARSENPRPFKLIRLGETSIKFGEPLVLPQGSNSIIWARIEIDRTPAGSLVSTLFKPPELSLKTLLRSGTARSHRFIPEIARAGFLLSPFVKDCSSFASLQSTIWPDDLIEDIVTAFSVAPANGSLPPAGYRDDIKIQLYQLDFSRQNLDTVADYHQVIELKEAIRRIKSLRDTKTKYLPGKGSVLAGSPYSAILLERPKISNRLRVGFGLFSNELQVTNGITFRASGIIGQRQGVLLWSQRLDQIPTFADRSNHEASIDLLNQNITAIFLETIPDQATTNETVLPFWSKMTFDAAASPE